MQINQNTIIFVGVVAVAVATGLYWNNNRKSKEEQVDFSSKLSIHPILKHMGKLDIFLNKKYNCTLAPALKFGRSKACIFSIQEDESGIGYVIYTDQSGKKGKISNIEVVSRGFQGNYSLEREEKYTVENIIKPPLDDDGGRRKRRRHSRR